MQRGTKHKPESLEAIKDKKRKFWDTIPPEKRKEIMKERAVVRIKNKESKT